MDSTARHEDRPAVLKPSGIVVWLGVPIAVLAVIATTVGLFAGGGPGQRDFTTIRGDTAQIYGHGLYRYDTVFSYFLYVYASVALGYAFSSLFLVYVTVFAASLYALIVLLRSIDLASLPDDVLARLPRRGPAAFMFFSGVVVLGVWLQPVVAAQTVSQRNAGVDLAPGEAIGPVAGFMVVCLWAIWVIVSILRAPPTASDHE